MFKKIIYGIGGIFIFLIFLAIIASTSNLKAPDSNVVENIEVATTADDIVASSESPAVDTKTQESEKQDSSPTTQAGSAYEYYSVSSVVDGDTIKINMGGTIETLRLIGIDTPETVDPRKPVQCFGKEASNKAKDLLSGKKVRIEKDATQGDRDKYSRLLVYAYREDGLFFNKYMIEQGYAHEYTYNLPYKYQTEFKEAEKYARNNQLGLWSPDTCNGDTSSGTVSSASTPAPTQTTGKYYTSSFHTAKYYYPESCSEWQSLSPSYLKTFNSLESLLASYPSRTLSPQCQ